MGGPALELRLPRRGAAEAQHAGVAVLVKDRQALDTHELGQLIGVHRMTSRVSLFPGLEAGLRKLVVGRVLGSYRWPIFMPERIMEEVCHGAALQAVWE